MISYQQDQILFLQNTLKRIKELDNDQEDVVILNSLLHEVYHYTSRSWSKELHEVILNIIKYSFKVYRILISDFEYYYKICLRESNIDKFIENFDELLKFGNSILIGLSREDYYTKEKTHRFIQDSYKNIIEVCNDNTKIINNISILFYNYCYKYNLKSIFISSLTTFFGMQNKFNENILDITIDTYINILTNSIHFKMFKTIVKSIDEIELYINKCNRDLQIKYFDIVIDYSLHVEDFSLHTYYLIRKNKLLNRLIDTYRMVISYLCINQYSIKNRIILKSIDYKSNLLLLIQQDTNYSKLPNDISRMINTLYYTDLLMIENDGYLEYIKNLRITILLNYIIPRLNSTLSFNDISIYKFKSKTEFIKIFSSLDISIKIDKKLRLIHMHKNENKINHFLVYYQNKNILLNELKYKITNNLINLKNIIPEETKEEKKERYNLAELNRIKSLDNIRELQIERNEQMSKDKELEKLKDTFIDKISIPRKISSRLEDITDKEELINSAQSLYVQQINHKKNVKNKEWNDYNRYIKVTRILELENLDDYQKNKNLNIEEIIHNKKIEHKQQWEKNVKLKERLLNIKKYI